MGTNHALPVLERIHIASPCPVTWEEMTGDEKTRHCAQCNLKVHNLSAMTPHEAQALLATKGEGRLCIGFYRRADGTILTQDCPVGIAAARARVRRFVGRAAAALGLVSTAAAAGVETSQASPDAPLRLRGLNPFSTLAEWLVPKPPPVPPAVTPATRWYAGDCVLRQPAPPPTPPGSAPR